MQGFNSLPVHGRRFQVLPATMPSMHDSAGGTVPLRLACQ